MRKNIKKIQLKITTAETTSSTTMLWFINLIFLKFEECLNYTNIGFTKKIFDIITLFSICWYISNDESHCQSFYPFVEIFYMLNRNTANETNKKEYQEN